MQVINKTRFIIPGVFAALFLLYTQLFHMGYLGINVLAAVSLAAAVYTIQSFLLNKTAIKENKMAYGLIIAATIAASLPFLTQSYCYGDDYWLFYEGINSDKLYSLALGLNRPFVGIILSFFVNTTIETMHIFRMVPTIAFVMLGCALYAFFVETVESKAFSFVLAVCAVASCTAMDLIGYASIYPMSISALLSVLAYFNFQKMMGCIYEKRPQKAILFFCVNIILLVSAFWFYQIGTPIIFVLLLFSIFKKEHTKEQIKLFFLCMFNYAAAALIYLASNKMIMAFYHITSSQGSRGKINLSWPFLLGKINWFFVQVLPQTANRITGLFFGNTLFDTDCMFYWPDYKNKTVGIIFCCIILLAILRFLLEILVVKKQIFAFFFSLCAIPLCFYPFLLLQESIYLTYYAYPLIILSIAYFLSGMACFIKDIRKLFFKKPSINHSRINKTTAVALCVLVVLQANIYAQKFWVNYNLSAKEYLKSSLVAQINEGTKNIHAIGSISAYVGGHAYVLLAIDRTLESMQLSPANYNITHMDNPYYIYKLSVNEYETVLSKLNQEEKEKFDAYYVEDTLYKGYYLSTLPSTAEEELFLQSAFIKGGIIPQLSEKDVLLNFNGYMRTHMFK